MATIVFKKNVKAGDPLNLVDFIEKETSLSKSVIKKVLNNGGCYVRKFLNSKRQRTRRSQFELTLESFVEFNFDPKFLEIKYPDPELLHKEKEWSLWYKPAGWLSSGNDFGDQWAMERFVFKALGDTFLIHRLDKETSGIMLFAHSKKAAGLMSSLWTERQIKKIYQVEVLGNIEKKFSKMFSSTTPIRGDSAETQFNFVSYNEIKNTSFLYAYPLTGRIHQIRVHLDLLGFPVIGDSRYGHGNKNAEGMKLVATGLAFIDPYTNRAIDFKLDNKHTLF